MLIKIKRKITFTYDILISLYFLKFCRYVDDFYCLLFTKF